MFYIVLIVDLVKLVCMIVIDYKIGFELVLKWLIKFANQLTTATKQLIIYIDQVTRC